MWRLAFSTATNHVPNSVALADITRAIAFGICLPFVKSLTFYFFKIDLSSAQLQFFIFRNMSERVPSFLKIFRKYF